MIDDDALRHRPSLPRRARTALMLVCALGVIGCSGGDASPSSAGASSAAGVGAGGAGGQPATGGSGAGAGSGGLDPALTDALQAALDTALDAAGAPGAVAAVRFADDSVWIGATGLSDVAGQTPMTPDALFHIGSVTKTFVASITLRLAASGLLSIDAPLADWLPDFPDAKQITVRQLLSHTSGIYNYTDSEQFWSALAVAPLELWTPEELTAIAAAQPPEFAPGEGWAYSNTNYILMGRILESATGIDARQLVEQQIAAPLSLADTSLSLTNADVPAKLVHGYHGNTEMSLAFEVSAAWTAGGMASSAADLTRFASSLLHGDVIDEESLEQMTTATPQSIDAGSPYGLGLMRVDTPLGTGWGHAGSIWGFLSVVIHVPQADLTVVALINASSGDETAIPAALIEVLGQLP